MRATTTRYRLAVAVSATALLGATGLAAPAAQADTTGPSDFESPAFSVGDIDGQNGWSSTGSYDAAVVAVADYANASGFGFGSQALRISDAVTSGAFGDQTFSPGVADAAGEGGLSHLTASFELGSTQATEQTGMHLSVSPDAGDGSRMSYLRFEDQGDGIHVFFDDVVDAGPQGTAADFTETDVATLTRSDAHAVTFDMTFVDGPGNDVVQIVIDGTVVATGTTWEDYYRYDPEQAGNGNVVPSVSTLLFRESGPADSGNAGNGYLLDDVTLTSDSAAACTFTTVGTTDTLDGDCVTDHTILVPQGHTLDGDGHTITAVDPTGGHFVGAVVKNAGTTANVTNVTVTASGLANVCDGGDDRLRGILFDGAAGSITDNAVTHINQGLSGCQEGNGIEVRNAPFDTSSAATRAVTISGNTVTDYRKTGIVANGHVVATITGNTVAGAGPVGYIAQNGIQIGFGGSATVRGNASSGNSYTGPDVACGLLFFDANGVKASSNDLFANERDQCNFGKGGGKVAPAS